MIKINNINKIDIIVILIIIFSLIITIYNSIQYYTFNTKFNKNNELHNEMKLLLNSENNIIFDYRNYLKQKQIIDSNSNLFVLMNKIIKYVDIQSLNLIEIKSDKSIEIKISGDFKNTVSYIKKLELEGMIFDKISIKEVTDNKSLETILLIRYY